MKTLDELSRMVGTIAPQVGNHLWQSTLFAVFVAILTLAFRESQARVRFGLWLTASVKFLVPFALLGALGSALHPARIAAGPHTSTYVVIEEVTQPFHSVAVSAGRGAMLLSLLPVLVTAVWVLGSVALLGRWLYRWQRVSATAREARPKNLTPGREAEMPRQLQSGSQSRSLLKLLLSSDWMEPGVFGVFKPVLIWPEGFSEHLSDVQMRAILAHELCHVRRRDNLAALLQMAVEMAFWFHPMVWWIGSRMIEERERACDEEVVRMGHDAEAYAEGILRACRFVSNVVSRFRSPVFPA